MSANENTHSKILFVDDDVVTCRVMQRNCDNARYDCKVYQDARLCLEEFKENMADLIITDLRMPGMTGFEFLSRVREIDETVPVIVMTGYSSVENAVDAMKRGANDFIKKPFDFAELRILIERTIKNAHLLDENQKLKKQLKSEKDQFGMIGKSPAMMSLFNTINKVAEASCNAIITGETGTGKELVARALHDYSPRKDAPFVPVDCGALTTSLLESELFGHEKGSFTGATQRKPGLLEMADGGTLFLDEICNISDAMQKKLMRAIEEGEVTRVGSTSSNNINVRIIVASNQDLEKMVEEGKLRQDFYHRLNVVNLHVPSLADRAEDVPALINKFVVEFGRRYNRSNLEFDVDSIKRLSAYNWPGNIRELRNVVERCVILSDNNQLYWNENIETVTDDLEHPARFSEEEFYSLNQLEEKYISHVLRCFKGKKTKAAEILGIDKTTLWRKLRRYDTESETV